MRNATTIPNYLHVFSSKLRKQQGLALAHLNVRSLLPKMEEIRILLSITKLDIFTVSETWLDSSVDDSEVQIAGYQCLRADRNRHGGGVAFYIKNDVAFTHRVDMNHPDMECIWVEVKLKNPTLICCLYRPPSAGDTYYNALLDGLEKAVDEDKHIVILGDFNINYALDDKNDSHPIRLLEDMF